MWLRVVGGDQCALLGADVAGVVGGEDHCGGGVDVSLAGLGAVDVQRDGAALAEAAAVVAELHPHLVVPAGSPGPPSMWNCSMPSRL